METALVILVICLAIAGIVYCIVKPRYAIVPVLLLFPIEQNLIGYITTLRYQFNWLVNVVVGLIAVMGVAYHFFRGERIFVGIKNRVYIAAMAFYAYIVVSIIWTPTPDSALFFISASWPYFVLWYLVSPLLTTRLADLEAVTVPLIICCALLMALMLVNPNAKFIDDRYVIDMGYTVGVGKTRSNPLAIADAGAALAITAALYRANGWRPMLLLMQAAAVLLGLTLALISGSRGQVLSAVALIAILLPFVNRTKNVVRIVGGIVIVFVVVGFLYFVFQTFVIGAAQDRWTTRDTSGGLGLRYEMAATALSAYATSPAFWLMGLGASAFNFFFPFRTVHDPHWYPHNILIETLTEYGLPGVVLMSIVIFGTLKNTTWLAQNAGDNRSLRTTALLFGGVTAFYLLMSCKQGALLGAPPFFMYCLIISRVTKNEQLAAAAAYNEAELEGYADDESAAPENEWGPASEGEPEPA